MFILWKTAEVTLILRYEVVTLKTLSNLGLMSAFICNSGCMLEQLLGYLKAQAT